MAGYCYICCDYCKQYKKCMVRNGGCERCEYWRYGECKNHKKE